MNFKSLKFLNEQQQEACTYIYNHELTENEKKLINKFTDYTFLFFWLKSGIEITGQTPSSQYKTIHLAFRQSYLKDNNYTNLTYMTGIYAKKYSTKEKLNLIFKGLFKYKEKELILDFIVYFLCFLLPSFFIALQKFSTNEINFSNLDVLFFFITSSILSLFFNLFIFTKINSFKYLIKIIFKETYGDVKTQKITTEKALNEAIKINKNKNHNSNNNKSNKNLKMKILFHNEPKLYEIANLFINPIHKEFTLEELINFNYADIIKEDKKKLESTLPQKNNNKKIRI